MKPVLSWLRRNAVYVIGCAIVGFCAYYRQPIREIAHSITGKQTYFLETLKSDESGPALRYVDRHFPISIPPNVICDCMSLEPPYLIPTGWPLVKAANDRPAVLRHMIKQGIDVNEEGPYGFTALHLTKSYTGRLYLIEAGAKINTLAEYNSTPLDLVPIDDAASLDLLLSHDARLAAHSIVDQRAKEKYSDAHFRMPGGDQYDSNRSYQLHQDFVKSYRQDKRNAGLLSFQDTVDLLLKRALDSKARQLNDQTVLVLLKYHPTLNQSNPQTGLTPLMVYCLDELKDRLKNGPIDPVIQQFVKSGAQVNAINPRSGYTALHYAVENHNYLAVKTLLACGANPNLKNKQGRTPRQLLQPYEEVLK